jgi:hypothetical protein
LWVAVDDSMLENDAAAGNKTAGSLVQSVSKQRDGGIA